MSRFLKKVFSFLPLIIAIFLLVYIIILFKLIIFSKLILLFFIYLIVLNILFFYIVQYPIDNKKQSPSFVYVLIKCIYFFTFITLFVYITFNIYFQKNTLPENEKYNYVIVFGAGVSFDKKKNYVINSRINEAIVLSKKDKNIKFVLSGGKGKDEKEIEAIYMKNMMIKNGVKENRILLDISAKNTYENISNSLSIIQNDILYRNRYESFIDRPFDINNDKFDLDIINIGFISSDFHLCRIIMMAKNCGIKRPYVISVATRPFYNLYYYIREMFAYIKAVCLSQIKIF